LRRATPAFVTAVLGGPFGLAGQIKARPLSGDGRHLLALRSVTLRTDKGERAAAVEAAELLGAGKAAAVLFKFRGVDSPEAARGLAGAEVLVPRAEAAPLEPGEFYIEDLKGLAVVDGAGGAIGVLADVVEGGGGFLAEIALPSGERRFAPFRAEFFGEVDVAAGRAVLLSPWVLA